MLRAHAARPSRPASDGDPYYCAEQARWLGAQVERRDARGRIRAGVGDDQRSMPTRRDAGQGAGQSGVGA
jgi:hypothetical protein